MNPKLSSESGLNRLIGQAKGSAPTQVFQLNMCQATAEWLEEKLTFTINMIRRFDQDDDDLAFSSGSFH
jgi:hypothetical protein